MVKAIAQFTIFESGIAVSLFMYSQPISKLQTVSHDYLKMALLNQLYVQLACDWNVFKYRSSYSSSIQITGYFVSVQSVI